MTEKPQSFMELAGAWPHEHDEGAQLQVDRDKCRYNCRRCQLEALVREHAGVVEKWRAPDAPTHLAELQARVEEAKWWASPVGETEVKLCPLEARCAECDIKRERIADLERQIKEIAG